MEQPATRLRDAITATPGRRYALELATVGVVYYAVAQIGLELSLVGHSVTPLWPPTGWALVVFFALGRRMWPAIAVAVFAVNVPISPTVVAAAFIAVGNTLAPLVASYLLRKVSFRRRLQRVHDVFALVFLGVLVSMTISATIGTTALVASGAVTSHQSVGTWLVWWTGDAMGVLIIAPFLWSLQRPEGGPIATERAAEAVVVAALLIAASIVAFVGEQHLMFLVFPILGWIAWRFEQRGAAPAALLVSVIATVAAVHELGPFADSSLVSRMVTLQTFNAAVAFVAIVTAAAVSQRERRAEQEHNTVEMLQRSLLPDRLSDIPGLTCAVRYIPASTDVKLGGDWYDIIPLPDGCLAFTVGDVVGHGVQAAAVMGQIRMALRAYALDDVRPADALRRLNRLVRHLASTAMATVWYGEYDPAVNVLSFASAGHLPALLVDAGGATFLEEATGPPLGAVDDIVYRQFESALARDAIVVLYTDGLVEHRDRSIDDGLHRLRTRAAEPVDSLEQLCDRLVDKLEPSRADDVAVLAIRPVALDRHSFHIERPAVPATIAEVRHMLHTWLQHNGLSTDETFDVVVATGEAYANAVQHAYGLTPGSVECNAGVVNGEFRCTIKDEGTWRERTDEPRTERGRGLAIMRGLMDSVEIETTAEGTEVRMCRRLEVSSYA